MDGDKLPGNVPEIRKVVGVQASYHPLKDVTQAKQRHMCRNGSGWEIVTEMDVEETHQTQGKMGDEWLQFTWTEENGSGGIVYSTNE